MYHVARIQGCQDCGHAVKAGNKKAHGLGPSSKKGSGGLIPGKMFENLYSFWCILVLLFDAKNYENRH